jgi:dihydrofolate synthase/folylpolyglutamate synthase
VTPEDLAYLFSLTNEYRSMKYDLRNMQVFMKRLNNPQDAFRSILIAGTNGKGSVAALLSAMMPQAGLYTSPHLVRLNERIRIGAETISDADLKKVYDEVIHAAAEAKAELLYPLTYFEMVTAMAFTYFRDRVRFAVLEVGLGGRLDATNVVRQDVSVITSIGLDHQEFLGSTIDAIAAEKAGIIKDHEPVVVGPEAELTPITEHAGKRLVTTRQVERTVRSLGQGRLELDIVTPVRRYSGLRPQMLGRHQIDNIVIAIRAAECLGLPQMDIEMGVNTAIWPGRLQRIPGSPALLLDGAHNPAAAKALAAFLKEFYPEGVCMIFACMSDKAYPEMLPLLQPHARPMIFTRAQSSRSADPVQLQTLVPRSQVQPNLEAAIRDARARSTPEGTILICGSLYLVGEAQAILAN